MVTEAESMTLPHRLDAALASRLYPIGQIGAKQLCWKIGISDDTLRRYRHGETRIPADVIMGMVGFFRDLGDNAFAAEVLGIVSQWWVTAKGEIVSTSDLDICARTHQGLLGVAGDAMAAARRNLGWVSVILTDGVAAVEYHERGISPVAVESLRKLLKSAVAVRRIIDCGDRTVSVGPELTGDAVRALEFAVSFAVLPQPHPWAVERLPMDGVAHATAQQLAALAASTGDLIADADKAGILPECSILRADGDDVISLQIGGSIPWSPSFKAQLSNRNVMSRADIRYGEMIRAHVLQAKGEGPTYHRLKGSVNGQLVSYRRPIFPCGDGLFLTHTDRLVA
jgi:hypothetical protein